MGMAEQSKALVNGLSSAIGFKIESKPQEPHVVPTNRYLSVSKTFVCVTAAYVMAT